jgi:hypothetical protein
MRSTTKVRVRIEDVEIVVDSIDIGGRLINRHDERNQIFWRKEETMCHVQRTENIDVHYFLVCKIAGFISSALK